MVRQDDKIGIFQCPGVPERLKQHIQPAVYLLQSCQNLRAENAIFVAQRVNKAAVYKHDLRLILTYHIAGHMDQEIIKFRLLREIGHSSPVIVPRQEMCVLFHDIQHFRARAALRKGAAQRFAGMCQPILRHMKVDICIVRGHRPKQGGCRVAAALGGGKNII